MITIMIADLNMLSTGHSGAMLVLLLSLKVHQDAIF